MVNNILIVDDDEDFLKVLSILLTREALNLTVVTTGQEALGKIHNNEFDLVLVDRKLPDIDGVELIHQIKDSEKKIRKVIFTGFPIQEGTKKAKEYGIDAYLTKPIEPKEILKVILEQLEIHNSNSNMQE